MLPLGARVSHGLTVWWYLLKTPFPEIMFRLELFGKKEIMPLAVLKQLSNLLHFVFPRDAGTADIAAGADGNPWFMKNS
jgi:hypothetical protein